ncbi:unnamed protein product, partial [Brassica oleracea var. botrytis]
ENDGTQTAVASLVKLSSLLRCVSGEALRRCVSSEVFGLYVPGQALVHASLVKPSAAASPTKFFTAVSPLHIYVIYVVRLTFHIRSSSSLTV